MTNRTSTRIVKKIVTETINEKKKGRTVAKRAGEKVNALKKVARRAKV